MNVAQQLAKCRKKRSQIQKKWIRDFFIILVCISFYDSATHPSVRAFSIYKYAMHGVEIMSELFVYMYTMK